jgi:hypothetical protein
MKYTKTEKLNLYADLRNTFGSAVEEKATEELTELIIEIEKRIV